MFGERRHSVHWGIIIKLPKSRLPGMINAQYYNQWQPCWLGHSFSKNIICWNNNNITALNFIHCYFKFMHNYAVMVKYLAYCVLAL